MSIGEAAYLDRARAWIAHGRAELRDPADGSWFKVTGWRRAGHAAQERA
ncbi:MAG: hypothetical protein U1E17_01075 [Geminicoccaceae bacterium]